MLGALSCEDEDEFGAPLGERVVLSRMKDEPSALRVHPVIKNLFRGLSDRGVDWVLLRGEERIARPTGDVDLLIAKDDLDDADSVFADLGFSRQGSALFVTRRAYVAYAEDDHLWIRFDVVSRVSFGPLLEFDTPTATQLLASKHRVGDVFLLDPIDSFWHLLLHYELDRGQVPAHWRSILQERSLGARSDGPLPRFLDQLPGCTGSYSILAAVREGDWIAIDAMFACIRQAWPETLTTVRRCYVQFHRLLQRCGLSEWTSFRPGVTVAILGPDGAGKTTLANGLRDELAIPTAYVYMGLWREGPLEDFLSHLPGSRLLLLLTRLIGRNLRVEYHRWRGRIVLLDRFTYDAALVTEVDSWRQQITARLVHSLSRTPDLLLILDLPGEVAFDRKGEQSVETLNEWREIYRSITHDGATRVVLDATVPANEVLMRATEAIWSIIQLRTAATRS